MVLIYGWYCVTSRKPSIRGAWLPLGESPPHKLIDLEKKGIAAAHWVLGELVPVRHVGRIIMSHSKESFSNKSSLSGWRSHGGWRGFRLVNDPTQ